jgi:arsenate reductase (thioredoxin)
MKILILSTGNSCRGPMAQGYLQSFDKRLEVYSAGTEPSSRVHPIAGDVMKKAGIDISKNKPVAVSEYLASDWDYVITVCSKANDTCPGFTGRVRHRMHIGFDDPSEFKASYVEILNEFYRVRNDIREEFEILYETKLRK